MPKISFPTKTFVALLFISFFSCFLALNLWADLFSQPADLMVKITPSSRNANAANNSRPLITTKPAVDTSLWKTYTNKDYGFSFKYKPDWKVLEITKKGGYNLLQIDPGKIFYNIKIYISDNDYYAIDGLPTQPDTIGGLESINVNNLLFGVKNGGNYFTFDTGLSTSLKPEFDALVHSVVFIK